MRNDKNKRDEATYPTRDQQPDIDGHTKQSGFLVITLKQGQNFYIGEAFISLNEVRDNQIRLAIQAPVDIKIRRNSKA